MGEGQSALLRQREHSVEEWQAGVVVLKEEEKKGNCYIRMEGKIRKSESESQKGNCNGYEELEQVSRGEVLLGDASNRDDLDVEAVNGLLRSDLVVHLLHSLDTGHGSVLLVDVVGVVLAVESEGDAVVLDSLGLVLENLVERNDLTSSAFDLCF